MRTLIPRGRWARTMTGIALSAGLLAGAMTTVSSSSAGAIGITHKLAVSPRNTGTAVEGSARMAFTCNDVTGAAVLSVTNVQVIQSDGDTPWSSKSVTLVVGPVAGFGDFNESWDLTQNQTNGLFQLKVKFNMALLDSTWTTDGLCATGSQVGLSADDTTLPLVMANPATSTPVTLT